MNNGRYLQLSVGVVVAACVGIIHSFGIVSHHIKDTYHFSQREMTTVTTVGHVLGYLTFPGGALFDFAGPKPVLIGAGVFTGSGFMMLHLIFVKFISPSVFSLAVANALTSFGIGFMDCGSLLTNVFTFPISRGEIIIIQKTFMGLGATFFALIFNGIFLESENYVGYTLFVSLFVYATLFSAAVITRLPEYCWTTLRRIAFFNLQNQTSSTPEILPPTVSRSLYTSPIVQKFATLASLSAQSSADFLERMEYSRRFLHDYTRIERRRLRLGLVLLWVALIFFSFVSFLEASVKLSENTRIFFCFVAVLILVSFFAMIFPESQLPAWLDLTFLPTLSVSTPSSPYTSLGSVSGASPPSSLSSSSPPATPAPNTTHNNTQTVNTITTSNCDIQQQDAVQSQQAEERDTTTTSQLLHHPAAINTSFSHNLFHSKMLWCFWLNNFSVWGTGALLVGNVSQIYRSINNGQFDGSVNALNVSLIGIGSALGRVVVGYGEMIIRKREQEREEANRRKRRQRQRTNNSDNDKMNKENADHTSASSKTVIFSQTRREAPSGGISETTSTRTVDSQGEAPIITQNPPPLLNDVKQQEMSNIPLEVLAEEEMSWQGQQQVVVLDRYSSVTSLLPFSPAIMAFGCVLLLVLPAHALGLGILTMGFAYGMSWGLTVLSVKEIFVVDTAKCYNFTFTAGIFAALLLNSFMFGQWYDYETNKQQPQPIITTTAATTTTTTTTTLPQHPSATTAQQHNISSGSGGFVDVHCRGRVCVSGSITVLAICNLLTVLPAYYIAQDWLLRRRRSHTI